MSIQSVEGEQPQFHHRTISAFSPKAAKKGKPAGDSSVLYTMERVQKPENLNIFHKNPTIKMLELIKLNQEQLQIKNHVARKPKFLFSVPAA